MGYLHQPPGGGICSLMVSVVAVMKQDRWTPNIYFTDVTKELAVGIYHTYTFNHEWVQEKSHSLHLCAHDSSFFILYSGCVAELFYIYRIYTFWGLQSICGECSFRDCIFLHTVDLSNNFVWVCLVDLWDFDRSHLHLSFSWRYRGF